MPVFPNKSRKELKIIAKHIEQENKTYGHQFVEIELSPDLTKKVIAAYRNRFYLAQIYLQDNWIRISVNRTSFDPDTNRWFEGITWDTLMGVKTAVGYGLCDAVEIYPNDQNVVNVANIRHLFILPKDHDLDCIWRGENG